MKPPFILIDKGDVVLFQSVDDLERYVESPDIESYVVFDANAQVLRLTATRPTSAPKSAVRIVPIERVTVGESHLSGVAELESVLRDFLFRATGKSYGRSALPELLGNLQATIGFTR